MKKIILLLVIALFTFNGVFAKFIDVQTAQNIAVTYYKFNANVESSTITASLTYTRTEADNTVDFYVFNINSKGFVIVSANDNADPVLAFSTETNFNSNMPNTGIQDWMDKVAFQMNYIIKNNLQPAADITSEWTAYSNGQNPVDSRTSSIKPLLETIWNQFPYYNQDCPGGSVTGCVATAMAQIMKFWNYPAKGAGSYSYYSNYGQLSADFGTTGYAWTSMPDALTRLSTTTQVDAVATLMYQAGISVAMEYSPGGSGAWVLTADDPGSPCAQTSYVKYFGYNASTIQGIIESNYSSARWSSMLEDELNAGRPIEYVGWGSQGGHTWVCDGYNTDGLFHMNWGWGGEDNGYYKTTNLNPGGTPLGSDNEALIGIEPSRFDPVLGANLGPASKLSNSVNNTIDVQSVDEQAASTASGVESLQVYPIPASTAINVKYLGTEFSIANVSVFNTLGQTITSYISVNLNSNYQLDISKYAVGVYFLSVTNPDASERKIIKFIKQ
jgi:hypothetical protein